MNPHPLAPSKEYLAKLEADGLLTIRVAAPPEEGAKPRKLRKLRPYKPKKISERAIIALREKQAMNPPRCLRSGCNEVCKCYTRTTGAPGDYYGKLCPKHADEAKLRQKEYNERRKLLGR